MNPNLANWRDLAVVSKVEAACILRRSPEWVADALDHGTLVGLQRRRGGPRFVCVQSLAELVDRMTADGTAVARPAERQWPRLAWINPAA